MIGWKKKHPRGEYGNVEQSFDYNILAKISVVLSAKTMLAKAEIARFDVVVSNKKVSITISERVARYRIEMWHQYPDETYEECIGVLYITYNDGCLIKEMRDIRIDSILE
jgi:hypothetical protein